LKPSVQLSPALGYRELGMYDQSFLELEEILGDERLSYEVLEAKFLACKGTKKREHAEALANLIRVHHPYRVDKATLRKERNWYFTHPPFQRRKSHRPTNIQQNTGAFK
jgi:hypothetical protein